jgi:hypothetical protein
MCFDLAWFENLLIWLVVVCAIVAILKLLLPLMFGGGIILRIVNIIVWAVITIFIIVVVFDLISCYSGSLGSLHFRILR